jgi:hypothetical protein
LHVDQGAGLIDATVDAVLVLFIWNRLVAHRVITDTGNSTDPRGAAATAVLGFFFRSCT